MACAPTCVFLLLFLSVFDLSDVLAFPKLWDSASDANEGVGLQVAGAYDGGHVAMFDFGESWGGLLRSFEEVRTLSPSSPSTLKLELQWAGIFG